MGQRHIVCVNCKNESYRQLIKVKGNRGVEFISKHHHIVACNNCGLVFLNPQHEDQDYEEYYRALNYREEKAISKDKILTKHQFKKIPIRFLTDYLESEREKNEAMRVLDIGCGFGESIKFMKESGLIAEGLEPSSDAAAFALKHFGVKVHVGSIFDHDLSHGSYDVLSSMAVIEHLTDPLAALKEMRNLLKPDGILFMNTPDLKGMVLRKGVERYFKFVHTYYYTNITLSSLIQLAGFEVLKTWQLKPILSYSTLFHPTNFKEGELNIIARRRNSNTVVSPLKDNVDEIFRIFEDARRRDERFSKFDKYSKNKILGYPLRFARKNLTKRQFVFKNYFDGTEVVSNYQTVGR